MTTLVADIEANGLFFDVTQIHCIVTKDKDTGEVKRFFGGSSSLSPDGSIEEGVKLLSSADTVVGHNWINYDAPVIRKFFPWFKIDVAKIRDTYIRSIIFDPHRSKHDKCPVSKSTIDGRKPIGAHGLENWGYVVGRGKVEHEDWSVFTEDMLRRCVEDVEITDLVDDYLRKEEDGWDWSQAELIEKQFAHVMSDQEKHGWLFDLEKAHKCIADLDAMIQKIDDEVLPRVPPVVKGDKSPVKQVRKKDGGYHTNFIKWFEESGIGGAFRMGSFTGGEFTRVVFEEINLASQNQIKEYLLSVGWEPTEWNYKKNKAGRPMKDEDGKYIKSSAKLTEDSFASLKDDTGKKIAERITIAHRRSQIQGWIDSVRPDGRVEAGGNSSGTNTGRVTHRGITNVPKAEDDVFYGKEMRSLFTSPEGYVMVGADLSALEDRLAGHHTFKYDQGDYARSLLEGDVHQKTADKMGVSRFQGKTCNHALKYGCQPPKLAEMLGVSIPQAKKLWDTWWIAHPSLSKLKERIEYSLAKRGFLVGKNLKKGAFIKGLDGRKIFLRSVHSALNARIQNAGSVVHKVVCIAIHRKIQERMLDAHIVGNFHDETQAEVREEDIDDYKEIIKEAEEEVNQMFGFEIPMKLEPETGSNWAETH